MFTAFQKANKTLPFRSFNAQKHFECVEFLNFGVLEKSHRFCAKYIRETAL